MSGRLQSSQVKIPGAPPPPGSVLDSAQFFRQRKLASGSCSLLVQNSLKEALALCDELLLWLESHSDNPEISARRIAGVYLSRSRLNQKLGNHEAALVNGERSSKTDRASFRGHQQRGHIFVQLQDSRNAISSFKKAYQGTLEEPSLRSDIKTEILMDIALAVKYISDASEIDKLLADCSAPVSAWTKVVEKLFEQEEWRCVFLLLSCEVTRCCKFSYLNYTGLFELPKHLWRKYGEPIILKLLEHNGQLNYLNPPILGSTALHRGVMMAFKTGSTLLLKTLLKKYFTSPETANKCDFQGTTALHVYAKCEAYAEDQTATAVLEVLMGHSCLNWWARDMYGRRPLDYIQQQCSPISNRIRLKMGIASKRDETKTKEKMKPEKSRQEEPGHSKRKNKPQNSCQACYHKLCKADKLETATACKELCNILTNNHRGHTQSFQTEVLQKMINIFFEGQIEVVPTPILKLPGNFLRDVVTAAFKQRRWHHVYALLSQYRSCMLGENYKWSGFALPCLAVSKFCLKAGKGARLKNVVEDLACDVDIAEYIRADFSKNNQQQRYTLLELMLLFKASPNSDKGKCPLTAAVEKPDFKAIPTLLFFGSSPTKLSLKQGDSPLHAAASIGLEKETGNFDSLRMLLDIAKKFKDGHPRLCLSVRDLEGDTVLHLAAKATCTKHSVKLVEILCENGADPNLRNGKDKTALECIPKIEREDDRLQYIRRATKSLSTVPSSTPANQVAIEAENTHAAGPGIHTSERSIQTEKPKTIEACKKSIIELIENFDTEASDVSSTTPKQSAIARETKRHGAGVQQENTSHGNCTGVFQTVPRETQCLDLNKGENPPDREEGKTEKTRDDIEDSVFDGLAWEVDCTAEVWKTLKNPKVPFSLKKRSVEKIKCLASGDRSKNLCKHLDGVPRDIKLFEAKVSKGSRIIWEQTVAFSPRHNVVCPSCPETDEPLGAEGGRIYSEIIRVWDIVLDHNYIHHSIEKIVKSHRRGRACIIKKNLHSTKEDEPRTGKHVAESFPRVYTEVRHSIHEAFQHYPPASAKETEYSIIKFYSFDSALVQNVLENQDIKVEFPFRVTELEHTIINLQPTPPSPLLLLGRSGTGKTTCCLYRLWARFVRYWEQAHKAGSPLLERSVTFGHKGLTAFAIAEQKRASIESEDGPSKQADTEDEKRSRISKDGVEPTEDTESDNCGGPVFDHLHQIFITKNAVLCSEVQKNFQKMSHACAAAKQHVEVERESMPNRFQDAHPAAYPFFLTSRQFMVMLDASLPPRFFFDRKEDYSLKRGVKGWTEGDGPLTSIPEIIAFWEEEEDEKNDLQDADDGMGELTENQVNLDPRREVTYEVFAFELWPTMKKKVDIDCHPTLVWVEIVSFIEGSVEALNTKHGYLSCEEYKDIGRKRAPNFSGDRDAIYKLFLSYRHLKSQRCMFDEGDIVFNLYQRMKHLDGMEWVIHQFFVDETQDFTQTELCLLIQCCQNPNSMFLTGDTAQSIMRGISFRFEDLKSLFYHANQSMKALGKTDGVGVPARLYQLTHNYRSHAGILNLASCVVDLMVNFFPDSFDRLQKDQGLFKGPKPVYLESSSFSDLALLLHGGQRETSHIEFGAHQAILVSNEATRDNLPEELSIGLVLTIFESKGLEFDDILLYNFFTNSQARPEHWRVVTDHLLTLIDDENDTTRNEELVVELDKEFLNTGVKSRPLKFDPNRHKVLNSELKHLYTALTRARVNVWIFDEDSEARRPMFEYFRARKLIHVIGTEDTNPEEGLTDRIRARQSTPLEWQEQGDKFYSRGLYNVAVKCYKISGNKAKETMARAQKRALDACQLTHNPSQLRAEFLYAAEEFLKCGLAAEAGRCLNNARAFPLLAHLYKKVGKFQHAALLYKKLGKTKDACHSFEEGLYFGHAVELLVQNAMFDEAIKAVGRYHMCLQKYKKSDTPIPRKLLINCPAQESRSVKWLSLEAAKYYHKSNDKETMLAFLDRLPNSEDRITFLLDEGLIDLAAPIMKAEGRGSEVAQRYFEEGKLEETLKYANSYEQSDLRAQCLLSLARQNPEGRDAQKQLLEAISFFEKRKNVLECGEAKLLLGSLKKDTRLLYEALAHFENHDAGYVECVDALQKVKRDVYSENLLQKVTQALTHILRLLNIPNLRSDPKVNKLYSFYGLEKTVFGSFKVTEKGERTYNSFRKYRLGRETIEPTARLVLHDIVMKKAKQLVPSIVETLQRGIKKRQQCSSYAVGRACTKQECPLLHQPHTQQTYGDLIKNFLAMIRLIGGIEKSISESKGKLTELKTLTNLNTGELCDELHNIVYPRNAHPIVLATQSKQLLRKIRDVTVEWCFRKHVKKEWKDKDEKARPCDTDFLLKIHSLSCLIGENPLKLWDLILEEERKHTQNIVKSKGAFKFAKKQTRGFWIHGEDCHNVVCYSYLRNFNLAVRYMHSNAPIQGLARMCQFFAFIVKQPEKSLVPSLANTARLLEIMTVWIVGFHLSHNQQSVAVLPASYLAAVNWWDAELQGKYNMGFYHALKQSLPKDRGSVKGRAHYLVRVMCGDLSPALNAIGRAFGKDSKEPLETGEAERVLVLALVLLINSGVSFALKRESGDLLRRVFDGLGTSNTLHGHPRVETAMSSLQSGKCRHDIIGALLDLLRARGMESLYQCTWKWEPNGVQGIYHERITSPNNILNRVYPPIVQCAKSAPEPTDEVDFEENLSGSPYEEVNNEKQDLEAQRMREEKIVIIQSAVRMYLERQKLQKLRYTERLNNKVLVWDAPEWDFYKVGNSMCEICGELFLVERGRESAGGLDATTDASQESNADVKHARDKHTRSEKHIQNAGLLEGFKTFYEREVLPVIESIDEYLQKNIDKTDPVSEAQNMEIKRLKKSCEGLSKTIKSLQDARQWGNTEEVSNHHLPELKRCFLDVTHKIDIIKKEERQRADQKSAMEETLGDDHEMLTADTGTKKQDGEVGCLQKVARPPRFPKWKRKGQNTKTVRMGSTT